METHIVIYKHIFFFKLRNNNILLIHTYYYLGTII